MIDAGVFAFIRYHDPEEDGMGSLCRTIAAAVASTLKLVSAFENQRRALPVGQGAGAIAEIKVELSSKINS